MTLSASATPAPLPRRARPDLERLQGEWELVDDTGEAAKPGQMSLSISSSRLCIRKGDHKDEGAFTLDVSKSPKQIDFCLQQIQSEGIYRLSDDTFVICVHSEGKTGKARRPRDFALSNDYVLTFRRKKR
jgi:uncharacterized protein (TIGR03067 family)